MQADHSLKPSERAAPLLSLSQVIARTGLDRDALLAAMRDDGFPRPLPLGPWHTGWSEGDVAAWLARREHPARPSQPAG